MAFYSFDRRTIDPSIKPWGYPLPAYLYDPVILLAMPNAPTVAVLAGVIAETPVSVSAAELSVPAAPTVAASTGVIAEAPVGDSVELSVPAVPSISVGTSVNESP